LQAKALKGEKPITVRPGSLLAPADLAATHAEAEKACGRQINDDELASYLMYPKVFSEFAATTRRYGPVSVLPTPVFFYGMQPGDEIAIEIEPGKTLVLVLMTIAETDEEGQVKVFFELNGQPRIIKVLNRSAAVKTLLRRKAEDGNESHVAAPMPGSVSTVAVRAGQDVKAGDVVATLEAMKMETVLHAPRSGKIAEILVSPGQQIDARDLLMRIE
jgi:pyruvate carboxylase